MRALVVCLLAVAIVGCGRDERGAAGGLAAPSATPTLGPIATAAPKRLRISAFVRRELAAGAIGVVDFRLRVGIAPSELMVNHEQTLEGVRWAGWGGPRATGRARVRTLVCDPTCAQGQIRYSSASIVLSRPRRCGGRRFYAAARMTYRDGGRSVVPATFLQTPC